MAVAVASSQSNTASSATSVTVTKPTGLAVDDGLVAVIYSYNTVGGATTINTPSGWEKTQEDGGNAGSDSQRIIVFVKIADSGDVAASDFTFDSSNTLNWSAVVMRTTGSRNDDIYDIGDTASDADTADPSFTLAATPSQNTVLYVAAVAGATNESYADSTSPVINGTNPTWTKQYNGNIDVFTASVETTAGVTSIDYTVTGSSASTDWFTTFTVINGQIDASDTLSLTTTSNTKFDPTGGAGAMANLTLTETTNESFVPTGEALAPTVWTTTTKS